MKPSARPAWKRLQAALETTAPSCAGDLRFVAERTNLDPEDLADMRETCATCPILVRCSAYRQLDKPKGGFWAGVAA